ncbi:MAG: hypothetical protein ACO3N7_03550 [Kiritimatiellia bacterium]
MKSSRILFRLLFLLIPVFFFGCDLGGSSGGGGGGGGGEFVGTWALYNGRTLSGRIVSYVHFKDDNTLFISNNADGSGVRVTGTYMVSGGELLGPFSNPPTGDGRIEARIDNGTLIMDFIEYWHTPEKTIPLSGRKL